MMEDKKYVGIKDAILFSIVFMMISLFARIFFWNSGAAWYYFSSIQRLIFGIIATYDYCQLYNINPNQVFSFMNWRPALVAGVGFLIFAIFYTITVCIGAENIIGLTASLFISHIILQQLTTGFYEEIVYRGLLLGGYFEHEDPSWIIRLFYAFVSFIIFGSIHLIDGNWITFLFTGSIGFSFAVIYLKAQNILIPMIFHFTYDVIANLNYYIEYNPSELFKIMEKLLDPLVIVMFVLSLIILLSKRDRA